MDKALYSDYVKALVYNTRSTVLADFPQAYNNLDTIPSDETIDNLTSECFNNGITIDTLDEATTTLSTHYAQQTELWGSLWKYYNEYLEWIYVPPQENDQPKLTMNTHFEQPQQQSNNN
ncbi:hypothetical protein QTN25_006282 [Entamoeba marina]